MKAYLIGILVGYLIRPFVNLVAIWSWHKLTIWNARRKRAHYECEQRHKGLALRK